MRQRRAADVMYSMKRTMCPPGAPALGIGRMSRSLTAALDHHVDFTGERRPRPRRRLPSITFAREIDVVHARKVLVERVRLTVTRSKPARPELARFWRKKRAVGRQGELHIELLEHRHQAIEVAAHQRLALP